MAGVTPKQIYDALIAAGFSTVQATGIMANMIHESTLDPEAVGDGGTSFGLVQFHEPSYPGAHTLVTGNPAADMQAQIAYLKQHVSPQAISGADGFTVAGNFAEFFERCTTCSHGNAGANGWQSRVDSAVTVINWIQSGKWPTKASPGGGGSSGGSPGGSTGGSPGGSDVATANPVVFTSAPVPGLGWAGPFISGVAGGVVGGAGGGTNQAGGLLGIATGVAGLTQTMSKIAQLFLLLFRPQIWLRFGAAIVGVYALAGAAYFMREAMS